MSVCVSGGEREREREGGAVPPTLTSHFRKKGLAVEAEALQGKCTSQDPGAVT